jgi:PPK2 family polyphosphate:nucleotide phosphotransferase
MKINLEEFRVRPGSRVKLKRHDPTCTGGFKSRAQAEERLEKGLERMAALQELLYAEDRWALLLIFQAMDAAGKDSAVKHVMSGLNPQGVQVTSFKVPSAEELDHDYLWRSMKVLPERGRIGVFNRSYYEEVLVVRVHPEVLAREKLPPRLVGKRIWDERFQDIRAMERYLARNGIVIRKFFLHVSKREQRRRFLERLDEPDKNWKFSATDVAERDRWNEYVRAYEEMLSATSTDHAPWYVVPADHKWFTHMVIAEAVVEALERLKLKPPEADAAAKRDLAKARRWLQEGKREKGDKGDQGGKKAAKTERRTKAAGKKAKAEEEEPPVEEPPSPDAVGLAEEGVEHAAAAEESAAEEAGDLASIEEAIRRADEAPRSADPEPDEEEPA